MKKVIILLLSLFLLTHCHRANNPSQNISDQFVESYYVRTDLKAAAGYCDGLALEKINKSLELTQGQAIDSSTHHPQISFKRLEGVIGPESAEYAYLLEIDPTKANEVKKKTRVKLRQRDNVWKVTQFLDQEMRP